MSDVVSCKNNSSSNSSGSNSIPPNNNEYNYEEEEEDEDDSVDLKKRVNGGSGTTSNGSTDHININKYKKDQKQDSTGHWGRNSDGTWSMTFGAIFIMGFCPLFANIFNDAILLYDGSLMLTLQVYFEFLWNDPLSVPAALYNNVVNLDQQAVQIFTVWMLFQLAITILMPGPVTFGHFTCAGHQLKYYVNGLNAYIFTHVLAFSLCYFGVIEATIIADNWRGLFICANIFGFLLSAFAYLKALVFPTHRGDCKFSGSRLYDIFMGVEHNPRFTDRFDFKLFFNTRPGMIAWTLINVSFAAQQYKLFGMVSKEMVLVNVIQFVYVADLFINESWYTRTIDIQHDHFGFYLAWGDSVWLPFCYTLQAQYLAFRGDIDISKELFIFLIIIFWFGYFIFRSVNAQKDIFRNSNGNCIIWGKPATFIRAKYITIDGKIRESLLLTSGWWGLARHFNYLGDLLICVAVCCVCGFNNILPYFYLIYMIILLLHRVERDHQRCHSKYGAAWEAYQQAVPYKVIPYIY